MKEQLQANPPSPGPSERQEGEVSREKDGAGLFATAGIVGAALASSCCILPLLLVTLGAGGAWVGSLTALEPYKPYFLAATGLFLAGGFWHVYFRPRKACADGYCTRPASRFVTKAVLQTGTVLAVLAATINYWAPLFY
ncbi:MAG: mercuric transporter MerT family protein [Woeseia sp.]